MVTQANGGVPRVLVVDDEAMLADLLAQALRHEGWETATAKDGLDALAKASSFHPDIVNLDVQMPRMDGLETLERLRARDPELPVLFLTARDAVADRVQGLRAGADDYVTKPFDLDEVAARVEALLRRCGIQHSGEIAVGGCTLHADTSRSVFPKLAAYVAMAGAALPVETVNSMRISAPSSSVQSCKSGLSTVTSPTVWMSPAVTNFLIVSLRVAISFARPSISPGAPPEEADECVSASYSARASFCALTS